MTNINRLSTNEQSYARVTVEYEQDGKFYTAVYPKTKVLFSTDVDYDEFRSEWAEGYPYIVWKDNLLVKLEATILPDEKTGKYGTIRETGEPHVSL